MTNSIVGMTVPNPYAPMDKSKDWTIVSEHDYVTASGAKCYTVRWADGTESVGSYEKDSALYMAVDMSKWITR